MSQETGARLRSLYESQGGVRAVFSSKVADYCASRPDYPSQLFEALQSCCNLDGKALIADVGAGTGLLTRGLLDRGYRVVAVEPNPQMRAACDHYVGNAEGYRSVEGCAEEMPLPSASVDLITAAQAFHWFEVERARAECLRVLRPDGQIALIWNDRLSTDPLHRALDDVFVDFGGDKRSALAAHEDRSDVARFFGQARPAEFTWPHEHFLDQDGLLSLAFSRSYMPERDSSSGQQVVVRVREIFAAMAVEGRICVRYTSIANIGRPQ